MRTARTVVAAILGTVALVGSAEAMPIDPPHGPGRPPVVQTDSASEPMATGFDWSSAGIGAAGGAGAFAIALAAGAGMRRRRPPSPGRIVIH